MVRQLSTQYQGRAGSIGEWRKFDQACMPLDPFFTSFDDAECGWTATIMIG